MPSARYITPPELAKRLGVAVEKVLGWINDGEIVAVNLASNTSTRPRWKISEEAIELFLLLRQNRPPPPTPERRYKRKDDEHVIKFY